MTLLWVLAAFYVGAPLLVKLQYQAQAAPKVERVDVEEWPREVADAMRRYEVERDARHAVCDFDAFKALKSALEKSASLRA